MPELGIGGRLLIASTRNRRWPIRAAVVSAINALTLTGLTACTDVPQATKPLVADHQASPASKSKSPAPRFSDPSRPRHLEDLFARIATKVPAFAGAYRDQEGRIRVLVTDRGSGVAAIAATAAELRGRRDEPDESLVADVAEYSFGELQEWYANAPALSRISGVTLTDLDEKRNRITVGVVDASVSDAVQATATSLGVPPGALRIEVTGPLTTLQTVRSRYRPLAGGLLIQRSINSGTQAVECTHGFVMRSTNTAGSTLATGFITNSHCTAQHYAVDNSVFYQNDVSSSNNIIGQEQLDTKKYLCPYQYNQCVGSDAAFVSYQGAPSYSMGVVYSTTSAGYIATGQYLLKVRYVNGIDRTILAGDYVIKSGSNSYTTGGNVTPGVAGRTCADMVRANDSVTLVCQWQADFMTSNGGDSGSPLYKPYANGSQNAYEDVTAVGELWGGVGCDASGNNCVSTLFSPMNQVLQDLGARQSLGTPKIKYGQ